MSQFMWWAAGRLFPSPPTTTRPQRYVVWICSCLSPRCLCRSPLFPHAHAVGADRDDICLLAKRQNSEVLDPSNLRLATSGCDGLPSVGAEYGFLICAVGSRSFAPHLGCLSRCWSLGGPEGERFATGRRHRHREHRSGFGKATFAFRPCHVSLRSLGAPVFSPCKGGKQRLPCLAVETGD